MMARWFTERDRGQEQRDELLSAYLDGRLGAEERAHLEAQLATDPALRAELEMLRRTVALVHDLPDVPIPRNFILPQTMAVSPRPVPLRSRRLLAPLLTAATSLAILLFVVVLVGDLLLAGVGRQLNVAPAAAPMEERQAVTVTTQVGQDAATSATAPALAMEATAETPVVAGEEDRLDEGAPVAMPSPLPSASTVTEEASGAGASAGGVPPQPAAPTFEVPGALAPTAAPAVGVAGTPVPTPTPAAEAGRVATAGAPSTEGAAAATPAPFVGEGYIASPASTETAKFVPAVDAGEEAVPGDEHFERETSAAGRPLASPRWVLEIALGLGALALGAATIWAWRARRR